MSRNGGTRRERVEQREESIVDSAHAVFSELGFDGATIAEIAGQAQVAEGTIYLYFKNKNALLEAVVGRFYRRITDGAAQGVESISGTRPRLEFLATHHLKHCLADWRILQLMMGLYRHTPHDQNDGVYRFNKTYVAVFDRVVRAGMDRGELNADLSLAIFRDLFYGGLEYSARTRLLRGDKAVDDEAIARSLVAILWSGTRRDIETTGGTADNVVGRLESVTDRLEALPHWGRTNE